MFLSAFADEVIASHVLIASEILARERLSDETLRELGAEILALDKLTVMAARQVRTIQAARDCWQAPAACFQACLDIWNQLPLEGQEDAAPSLAAHARLLERQVRSARERVEFYSVTPAERAAFNAGRDHYFPATFA